jgi:hypothetical protein
MHKHVTTSGTIDGPTRVSLACLSAYHLPPIKNLLISLLCCYYYYYLEPRLDYNLVWRRKPSSDKAIRNIFVVQWHETSMIR